MTSNEQVPPEGGRLPPDRLTKLVPEGANLLADALAAARVRRQVQRLIHHRHLPGVVQEALVGGDFGIDPDPELYRRLQRGRAGKIRRTGVQAAEQTLPEHTCGAGQANPQLPQFATSLVVSAQTAPHCCSGN